jgi:hypothetical protein
MEPHAIDSLGVVPAWSTDEAWRIADSADYVIGSADGEHDAFMYVRAATQLSSGNVAILDMGVPGIRFYGVDGSHVRTIGQRGEGPGDFSVPASMAKGAGDTLIVADATQRRITVLDSAGRYIRSLGPASVERGDLMVLGMIGDGRVLIRVGDVRVWQDGLVRDTVVLGVMTLDSGDVTILARLPDAERVVELQDAAGNQTQREAPFDGPPTLRRTAPSTTQVSRTATRSGSTMRPASRLPSSAESVPSRAFRPTARHGTGRQR